MNIILDGCEYELATTLRVAYKLQGYNNHKSYLEIFQNIGEMTLEKQIEILYTAFEVANPSEIDRWNKTTFLNCVLDNYNASQMLHLIEGVTTAIMGVENTSSQDVDTSADVQEDSTPTNFLSTI